MNEGEFWPSERRCASANGRADCLKSNQAINCAKYEPIYIPFTRLTYIDFLTQKNIPYPSRGFVYEADVRQDSPNNV